MGRLLAGFIFQCFCALGLFDAVTGCMGDAASSHFKSLPSISVSGGALLLKLHQFPVFFAALLSFLPGHHESFTAFAQKKSKQRSLQTPAMEICQSGVLPCSHEAWAVESEQHWKDENQIQESDTGGGCQREKSRGS